MKKYYYTLDLVDNKTNKQRITLLECYENENLLSIIKDNIKSFENMGYTTLAIKPQKTKKQALDRMNTLNKQFYNEKRLINKYRYSSGTSIYWGL